MSKRQKEKLADALNALNDDEVLTVSERLGITHVELGELADEIATIAPKHEDAAFLVTLGFLAGANAYRVTHDND
jgi:hypothetical protein